MSTNAKDCSSGRWRCARLDNPSRLAEAVFEWTLSATGKPAMATVPIRHKSRHEHNGFEGAIQPMRCCPVASWQMGTLRLGKQSKLLGGCLTTGAPPPDWLPIRHSSGAIIPGPSVYCNIVPAIQMEFLYVLAVGHRPVAINRNKHLAAFTRRVLNVA